MADTEGFLGRWSRLKRQADTPGVNPPLTGEQKHSTMPPGSLTESGPPSQPLAEGPRQGDRPPESPAPTLEDVAHLTPASDFADFVAAKTPTLVKNAALKKLFSDPHFNIMDGLDIYIDDYSLPDPMPDDWLDKLEHAKGWLTPSDAEREAARAVTSGLPQPTVTDTSDTSDISDLSDTADTPDTPAATEANIANGETQDSDILSMGTQNRDETFCPEHETLTSEKQALPPT